MSRAHRAFAALARRRTASVVLVFALATGTRLALLPLFPPPTPSVHDEFSYLLAADTFARGRLTNPPHPQWRHMETFHVLQQPTYASMYPPAQGLFLAAGQFLFGHPWAGVVLGCALFCAATCWMLQGWLPPAWALTGALLVTLRLAFLGYWVNSYWGGAVAALGGALVVGALPRLRRRPRVATALVLAAGLGLLANSRPLEGLVLGMCVTVAALAWFRRREARERVLVVRRAVLPAGIALALVAAAMAYYFWRVTGDPLTMPFVHQRATYAVARYFPWQDPRPAPFYRHDVLRRFYADGWELAANREAAEFRTAPALYLVRRGYRVAREVAKFQLGPLLALPLLALPLVIRDRRLRFLVVTAGVCWLGLALGIFFYPHYAAPVTPVLYALVVQSFRHLGVARWGRNRIGPGLRLGLPLVAAGLCVVQVTPPRGAMCPAPDWPTAPCEVPESPLRERARVLARLESEGGRHLVLVRYRPDHDVLAEWVYNEADVDGAQVVWVREPRAGELDELLTAFAGRRVWRLEPDARPIVLAPVEFPADRPASPPASGAAW